MTIVCFDLEGTLTPELWLEIAEYFGVEELKITTRDEPDENKLMENRIQKLNENNIKYSDILKLIERISPFEGAVDLLNSLPPKIQPVIVTSSYYQFIPPLLKKLGKPFAFANFLEVSNDRIIGYKWRTANHKRQAVEHFKAQNFHVLAVGDSYNDIPMFEAADNGFFYNAPAEIIEKYPNFNRTKTYKELRELLTPS